MAKLSSQDPLRVMRKRRRGEPVPPLVRDSVMALTMEGSISKAAIARGFGLDPGTVAKLAKDVDQIDPAHVSKLRAALPGLMTILATAHGLKALETVDDPAMSARSTFAAKMAVESAKAAGQAADGSGGALNLFINRLNIAGRERTPHVIDTEFTTEIEPSSLDEGGSA